MMKFNNKNVNKMYIWNTLVNRINDGDFQYMAKHEYASDYLTFDIVSGGTIVFSLRSSRTGYTKTISASTDNGQTWTEMQSGYGSSASTINVSAGDKVIFKGMNAAYDNNQNCSMFSGSTAYFNLEGNIMSLIYGDDFRGQTTLTEIYTFRNLFMNTNVISSENLILPATTLADECYYGMFYNCTSLRTVPSVLPATELTYRCYYGMFNGCRSLTTAPELPATTLTQGCYQNMFLGCTSITSAPELPATTLADYCYSSMFFGCTSLTTAPSILPATTLANYCYSSMFRDCTNLTTAPELPSTTLATNCYSGMFRDCTSLNYAKCLATDISATSCTTRWMENVVSSTGTFVKAESMNDWPTGDSGIPNGWTVVDA